MCKVHQKSSVRDSLAAGGGRMPKRGRFFCGNVGSRVYVATLWRQLHWLQRPESIMKANHTSDFVIKDDLIESRRKTSRSLDLHVSWKKEVYAL